jgi:hypothetical protein
LRYRVVGVAGLDHLEMRALEHQPSPSASELANGAIDELPLAGLDAAICSLHLLL